MSGLRDFTPIKWMKESWTEAGEQLLDRKKDSFKKEFQEFQARNGRVNFTESERFYEFLDLLTELKNTTVIEFTKEKPTEKSKLWKRLARCKNWSELEDQFKEASKGKKNEITKIINPSMVSALTGTEFVVIWVFTLLVGVMAYGVYKGYKIRLKTNPESGEIELEMDPA